MPPRLQTAPHAHSRTPKGWELLFTQTIEELSSYPAALASIDRIGGALAAAFEEAARAGFTPDDVTVCLRESQLCIDTALHREQSHRRFNRTVPLPFEIDRDTVIAQNRDGVLALHLPVSVQL